MKFPTFEGVNSTYKNDADNADLRKAIVKAVPKATQQMKEFSAQFSGANDQQTCKKIFDFLKNQIRYKADGANQIVRFPSALLKTKTGDCKSYSLLTAAILNNLKIPCKFVLQSFNDNPTPSHIYVETMSGVKCDAVWGKFNSEKPSTYRYTIPMNVKYMAGIGSNCDCPSCKPAIGNVGIDGTGELTSENRKKCEKKYPVRRAWRNGPDINAVPRQACFAYYRGKDVVQDFVGAWKKVNFFVVRLYFKLIFENNVEGWASGVQKQNAQAKWAKAYVALGGKESEFYNFVKSGASKPAKSFGFMKKLKEKAAQLAGVGISGDAKETTNKVIKSTIGTNGTKSRDFNTWVRGQSGALGLEMTKLMKGKDYGASVALSQGLAEYLIQNKDSLIDMAFPIADGKDPNVGDPSYGGGVVTPPVGPEGAKKAGYGGIILPALIGVGVIMALNAGKKSK